MSPYRSPYLVDFGRPTFQLWLSYLALSPFCAYTSYTTFFFLLYCVISFSVFPFSPPTPLVNVQRRDAQKQHAPKKSLIMGGCAYSTILNNNNVIVSKNECSNWKLFIAGSIIVVDLERRFMMGIHSTWVILNGFRLHCILAMNGGWKGMMRKWEILEKRKERTKPVMNSK